jgi:hypothetical protein
LRLFSLHASRYDQIHDHGIKGHSGLSLLLMQIDGPCSIFDEFWRLARPLEHVTVCLPDILYIIE